MPDLAPLLERAFTLDPDEQVSVVAEVAGDLPDYFRGTYYLNGPGRFARGGIAYRHWLDGDGMVSALRFDGRRVLFSNRIVRTAKFVAEEEAGRPIFRAFGTAFPADRLKRGIATESPANVSVYACGGALLAFGEQGLPIELEPETLETRGAYSFGGALSDVSPFSAHPKRDPGTGGFVNFGVSFSAAQPCLHVYEFDAGGRLASRRRVALEAPCSVHDFAITPRYAVFYVSPYLLDVTSLLGEGRTTMESLRWRPELGSRILVVARESGTVAVDAPIGRGYCLHLINAFEGPEDGRLIVDLIEYDRPLYDQYQTIPDLFVDVGPGRPVRFSLDLDGRHPPRTRGLGYGLAPDFPSIDPDRIGRPYRHFWMLGISRAGEPGRKFFDQLVHCDWRDGSVEVYHAEPGHYLGGEPVFIPGPPGRDTASGVVICQDFDAARRESAFAVFDASHVSRGPLARLRLSQPIPFGFHASFDPAEAVRLGPKAIEGG
jgi:all-trans-8'-apo-beta-carotenal 15,15'-oxygenase